jgi:hypothetical protein
MRSQAIFRGMHPLRALGALAAGAALVLCGAPVAQAATASTFTVSGFVDGAGTCGAASASGSESCTTLRAAVSAANSQTNSPTIKLGQGTYTLSSGALTISAPMTIHGAGPGGAGGTTIKQTAADRVIEISSFTGVAGLIDLEVTGGNLTSGNPTGAGIDAHSLVSLENLLVTGNTAVGTTGSAGTGATGSNVAGGGVYLSSADTGASTIDDTTISGNLAQGGEGSLTTATPGGNGGQAQGGGVFCCGSESLLIDDSTIVNNRTLGGEGGGSSAKSGNGGAVGGGAMFAVGKVTIRGSTIAGNGATAGPAGTGAGASLASGGNGEGGGIDGPEAQLTIVNSTVSKNQVNGGSAPDGAPGGGFGGGLLVRGSEASLTLASDTLADNVATTAGNLESEVSLGYSVHDTIIAGGQPTNCFYEFNSTPVEGHNLESDVNAQCGFTHANGDLVGVNPQLAGALANNGGPTQTLAPAVGSPVLGAGGHCVDPSSSPPNQALKVDQRGLPRPSTCDIGSFQHQPPVAKGAPKLSGAPGVVQTLACSQGTWTGDALQFSYQWLRDGRAIHGQTKRHYLVNTRDAGHRIVCKVTAKHYGSASRKSAVDRIAGYVSVKTLTGTARGAFAALLCHGTRGEHCTGRLELTTVEVVQGGKVIGVVSSKHRTAIVGSTGYSVAAGGSASVLIPLNPTGKALLKKFHNLRLGVIALQRFGTRLFRLPVGL